METTGARADLLRLEEAMTRARQAVREADATGVWKGPAAVSYFATMERQRQGVDRLARVAEGAGPLVLGYLREADARSAVRAARQGSAL